jgi:hypothetical protein
MRKHICGAQLDDADVRMWISRLGLKKLARGRCKVTAVKTKRGAWRCPLHGGLSTGPKSPEGRARISAAARQRWAAYRAAKAAAEIKADTG